MEPLIIDALATGQGKRMVTQDVIGAGPRALAGVLEQQGLKPSITVAEKVIEGRFILRDYSLLLVSGMTSDLTAVRRIISKWKKVSKGPVVVGGPISSNPEDAIIRAKGDLAVIGEGERTLEELLDIGMDRGITPSIEKMSNVLGIVFHNGSNMKFNGFRPTLSREDYNQLMPSTKTIKNYPLYYSARVYVEVLRGCSNYLRVHDSLSEAACVECDLCRSGKLEERYDCPRGVPPGCGYCSVPSLYGPPKSRSVDKVYREIRSLLKEGVKRLVLSAPDFLDYGRDLLVEPKPLTDPRSPEPNYDAIEELLFRISGIDLLIEEKASLMVENVKGSLVTKQAAKLLGRYLQGTPVNIGFETGCRKHSRYLGRPSTPEENISAVRRLKRYGLKPYVYFIHGLPGQTTQTVNETTKAISRSLRAGASRIILYRFKSLPMSALYHRSNAPPAIRDPLSFKILKAARRANISLKEDLRGRKIRVVVAEPYARDTSLYVTYPLRHGPVVLVEGAKGLIGDVVEVKIIGIISDRILEGRLIDTTF